jgi:hypothetical protein
MNTQLESEPRLPAAAFIVFGLLTFWLFTVIEIYRHMNLHMRKRRSALVGIVNGNAKAGSFYRSGFMVRRLPFLASGLMYCIGALLLGGQLYWYTAYPGQVDHNLLLELAGLSLLVFYLANLVFILSFAHLLRDHEVAEYFLLHLLVQHRGKRRLVNADELESRWNRVLARLVLLLVATLPMVFVPHMASELVRGGALVFSTDIVIAICGIAGIFHLWSTMLVIGMYNGHVAFEDRQLADLK